MSSSVFCRIESEGFWRIFYCFFKIDRLKSVDPSVGPRKNSVLREIHLHFSMSFTRAVVALPRFCVLLVLLSWTVFVVVMCEGSLFAERASFCCSLFGTRKRMPIITRRIRELSMHVLEAIWSLFLDGLIPFGPFSLAPLPSPSEDLFDFQKGECVSRFVSSFRRARICTCHLASVDLKGAIHRNGRVFFRRCDVCHLLLQLLEPICHPSSHRSSCP